MFTSFVSSNRHQVVWFGPDITNLSAPEKAWGGIRDGGHSARMASMYAFLARHPNGRGLTPGSSQWHFYDTCLRRAASFSREAKPKQRTIFDDSFAARVREARAHRQSKDEAILGMTMREFDELLFHLVQREEAYRILSDVYLTSQTLGKEEIITMAMEKIGKLDQTRMRWVVTNSIIRLFREGKMFPVYFATWTTNRSHPTTETTYTHAYELELIQKTLG